MRREAIAEGGYGMRHAITRGGALVPGRPVDQTRRLRIWLRHAAACGAIDLGTIVAEAVALDHAGLRTLDQVGDGAAMLRACALISLHRYVRERPASGARAATRLVALVRADLAGVASASVASPT